MGFTVGGSHAHREPMSRPQRNQTLQISFSSYGESHDKGYCAAERTISTCASPAIPALQKSAKPAEKLDGA
jgi:hypothetical protein